MKTIQTSEIEADRNGEFPCPECAVAGQRAAFKNKPGLGSHRLAVHEITGTSTGSNAYKQAHTYAKHGAKRTYTKRTSVKRGPYNKTRVNPIIELLSNPAEFVGSLDSLIYERQAEVARLQTQIDELDKSIVFLRKFQAIANTPTQHFQEVA